MGASVGCDLRGFAHAADGSWYEGGWEADKREGPGTEHLASGWAEGPEGCALNGEVTRGVPAGASVEGVFFVLPAASMEDAVAAAAWSGFTELP